MGNKYFLIMLSLKVIASTWLSGCIVTPDLTNNRDFMRVCFRKIRTMKFTSNPKTYKFIFKYS